MGFWHLLPHGRIQVLLTQTQEYQCYIKNKQLKPKCTTESLAGESYLSPHIFIPVLVSLLQETTLLYPVHEWNLELPPSGYDIAAGSRRSSRFLVGGEFLPQDIWTSPWNRLRLCSSGNTFASPGSSLLSLGQSAFSSLIDTLGTKVIFLDPMYRSESNWDLENLCV